MRTKILAFSEGFILVAIEFLCAQLLYPLYGNSYFVWIAILSITVLSTGLGYFIGGWICKLSDKKINTAIELFLFLLLLSVASITNLHQWLFDNTFNLPLITGITIHATGLLSIPMLLISSFSPIIIRFSKDESSVGKKTSTIFFLSTLGAVISIFVVVFGVIPGFGLELLSFGIFVIILIIGSIRSIIKKQYIITATLLLLLVITTFQKTQSDHSSKQNVLYQNNGIFGEVLLTKEDQNLLLYSNKILQSAIRVNDMRSAIQYPYAILTYTSLAPEGSDILLAGLGGGVLVNELNELGYQVDCIELDKRMKIICNEYLSLTPKANIITDDFRHYINANPKTYEVIILDLSQGEFIPSNVYTLESFRTLLTRLNETGFIILHYFIKNDKDDKIINSITKTLHQAGAFVGFINTGMKNAEKRFVVASKNPQLLSGQKFKVNSNVVRQFNFNLSNFLKSYESENNGIILYDDILQLESMQLQSVKEVRSSVLKFEHSRTP